MATQCLLGGTLNALLKKPFYRAHRKLEEEDLHMETRLKLFSHYFHSSLYKTVPYFEYFPHNTVRLEKQPLRARPPRKSRWPEFLNTDLQRNSESCYSKCRYAPALLCLLHPDDAWSNDDHRLSSFLQLVRPIFSTSDRFAVTDLEIGEIRIEDEGS